MSILKMVIRYPLDTMTKLNFVLLATY